MYLRIFGYFGELLHRVGVALLTIMVIDEQWGMLYACLLVFAHMLFIIVRRPYNRTDVYVAACLSDGSTIIILLSISLYRQGLLISYTMDIAMVSTTWLVVISSLLFHVYRQCTVVQNGLKDAKSGVGGPKHRNTGSSWGRRYHYGDDGKGNERDQRDESRREETEVVLFEESDSADAHDHHFDASSQSYPNIVSPPQTMPQTTQNDRSTTRKEKDIRFKLKAWWYRYSFVQRWHDIFRKEHHKIPSRVDQGKDPDLIRNQQRLDQRSKELFTLGVSDPASAFRERNLKPKQDNRLVMVPKDTTNDGFEVIKKEENFLAEKRNFGLRVERGPDDLNSYDNVLRGEQPGSVKKIKSRTKRNQREKEEWEDPLVVGNGQHRLHQLPRRSIYNVMTNEEKQDNPSPLPIRPAHLPS